MASNRSSLYRKNGVLPPLTKGNSSLNTSQLSQTSKTE